MYAIFYLHLSLSLSLYVSVSLSMSYIMTLSEGELVAAELEEV